jgi:UDP-N-acetylglucosamine 3-dehydrogenase
MTRLRAAILGCGGRGRAHAAGYAAATNAEIVACADPALENARALAEKHAVPHVYADYRALLDEQCPDVVSICTWPHLHREMVDAAVAAGVKAIHCEKPMAPTFGEARAMHQAAEQAGAVMTFCHQRRFSPAFRAARDLIRGGAIGELVRMEGYCSNFFDWGTHWFDMFHYFNEDRPAAWVIGQVDVSAPRQVFGVPVETSGISHVAWANDVWGLLITGRPPETPRLGKLVEREGMVLHGTEGRIEVAVLNGPRLRVRRFGGRADEEPALPQTQDATVLSVLDLLECLQSGREPELSSRKALRATELIFATYESSRRRGRVALPLAIDDSPLLTGLEQGFWQQAEEARSEDTGCLGPAATR